MLFVLSLLIGIKQLFLMIICKYLRSISKHCQLINVTYLNSYYLADGYIHVLLLQYNFNLAYSKTSICSSQVYYEVSYYRSNSQVYVSNNVFELDIQGLYFPSCISNQLVHTSIFHCTLIDQHYIIDFPVSTTYLTLHTMLSSLSGSTLQRS